MSHTRQAAGDTETAIELVDVAKAYTAQGESVAAVRKVDLAIRSGEFFSLLGPSGCGKTTTLRMVAGFEQPTQGQILLYGKDVVGVSAHQRDLNMVFQSYALFPHMNVYDNVAFGLRRKKVSKAEVDRRVREMLTLVDLEGREKRRPHEMSGGQQQRVALARALVNEPRALLLDEPLGALDLKLRQAMQSELKRIQREVGITFVYVTHDQGEALTMSDRIAVMNQGVVEQLGTPREIYEQPRTRFVADFIGTSNFVTLQVTEAADRLVCDLGDDQRVVVPLREHRPAVGARIEITVRPEKLQLADRRPVTDCAVRGEVTEVVYQGTFTAYVVQLPATGDVVQAHVQNVNDAFDIAAVGDRVWLGWDLSHSYLLTQDDAARAGSSGRDPVESSVTSEPAHAATRGETS